MRSVARLGTAALCVSALPAAAGAKTAKVKGTATVTVTATIMHVGAKQATGTATFSGTTDAGTPLAGHGPIKVRGSRAGNGTFHSSDAKLMFTGQLGSDTKIQARGVIHWPEGVTVTASGPLTADGTLSFTGGTDDGQSI